MENGVMIGGELVTIGLFAWLLRTGTALTGAGLLVFLITASTSNSFASKSVSLGLLVSYVVAAAAYQRMRHSQASPAAQGQQHSGRKTGHHFASPRLHHELSGPHVVAPAVAGNASWHGPRTSGLS